MAICESIMAWLGIIKKTDEATQHLTLEEVVLADRMENIKKQLRRCLKVKDLNKLQNCVEVFYKEISDNSSSWVESFGVEGIDLIYSVIEQANKANDTKLQQESLKCLKEIMNSQWGLETVLEFNKNSAKKDLNDKGLNLVVRCLAKGTPELMIRALQILAPACLVNHEKVLHEITNVAHELKFNRFVPIINALKLDNVDLQSLCLQLINALLKGIKDLESRIELRTEILRQGLSDKLNEYENERNPKIVIQYNVFQKESEYDNEELKVYLTSTL